MILEADDQQNQDNNNQDNQDNNNQNKAVKGDAGTYKEWPSYKTTMRGWIKVMSGQEEVKSSFFEAGFLVPITVQNVNANAATATLEKQLDNECIVKISEYKNDYMFSIMGLKPYGYASTGWTKGKGPQISDIIKNMKAELKNSNNNNDNKNGNDGNNNDNGNSGGTM